MNFRAFLLSRRGSSLAAALLLLAFLAQGALGVRFKSITTDEDSHLSYGQQVLTQHTFFREIHRHNATSPWMAVNALPGLIAEWRGADLSPQRALYQARLPSLLWGALLGWLVFCWAREAFGIRAGLLAVTLAAFCPNLLAHSALVTTDAVTTLAIFAALYAFWRYHVRPSPIRLHLAGIALGLALTTKLSAVYLVPVLLLILAFQTLARRRFERAAFASLLLIFLIAGLVINAVYLFEGTFTSLADSRPRSIRFQELAATPVLGRLPLPLPTGYIQGIDWTSRDMARPRWTYCLGRYSADGFPYYYAVALLTKATLGLLALMALTLLVSLRRRKTPPSPTTHHATNIYLFLLTPILFYFVWFNLFFHFQIGLRHLLPIFPFLFVLVSRLAELPRRSLATLAWLLAAIHAASSLRIHPHYLAYFNEAAGGPLQGWRYLIDSNLDWGQDRGAVRFEYVPHSPVPVILDPRGPTAGRIVVRANDLVGLGPASHQSYAWLREHFEPVDHIGYSWLVYDVSPADLRRCCGDLFRELPEEERWGNLAPLGKPIGGAEAPGIGVSHLNQLNDGRLGSNSRTDAARTNPAATHPVPAWFGIDWGTEPRTIDRLVAYPGFYATGPQARVFTATETAVQIWQDGAWVDIPGTRAPHDGNPRLERRFAPVTTSKIRLRILGTRNHRGLERPTGRFRAACLEIAVYGPEEARP